MRVLTRTVVCWLSSIGANLSMCSPLLGRVRSQFCGCTRMGSSIGSYSHGLWRLQVHQLWQRLAYMLVPVGGDGVESDEMFPSDDASWIPHRPSAAVLSSFSSGLSGGDKFDLPSPGGKGDNLQTDYESDLGEVSRALHSGWRAEAMRPSKGKLKRPSSWPPAGTPRIIGRSLPFLHGVSNISIPEVHLPASPLRLPLFSSSPFPCFPSLLRLLRVSHTLSLQMQFPFLLLGWARAA